MAWNKERKGIVVIDILFVCSSFSPHLNCCHSRAQIWITLLQEKKAKWIPHTVCSGNVSLFWPWFVWTLWPHQSLKRKVQKVKASWKWERLRLREGEWTKGNERDSTNDCGIWRNIGLCFPSLLFVVCVLTCLSPFQTFPFFPSLNRDDSERNLTVKINSCSLSPLSGPCSYLLSIHKLSGPAL